ncbi:MAG: hypothetical protein INR68_18855 [Methylobacterium mesophilicum]|nr:hypothetical protein [Methylobacterium mesophilicum]
MGELVSRVAYLLGAMAISMVAAYPAYLWALRREAERHAALELAAFEDACANARLRLAGGGEFWSARIMVNRCDAAGR